MKVTLNVCSYIPHLYESIPEHKNSNPLPAKEKIRIGYHRNTATKHADKRTNALDTRTYGAWNSRLSTHQTSPTTRNTDMQGLGATKKTHWPNTHSYPSSVFAPVLLSLGTMLSMPMTSNHSPSPLAPEPGVLLFSFAKRELRGATTRIQLTAIEAMLIKSLTLSESRICSKHELILGIDKDTHSYSGLEMCLSRLQNKFRDAFGERLFRSVRNRGYCLVQDVQATR